MLIALGTARAFGEASVCKYIGHDFSDNIGTASGIVDLSVGLGGFMRPIMFGALMDLTGIRFSGLARHGPA